MTERLSLHGSYMYAPGKSLSGSNSLSGQAEGSQSQTLTIAMSQQELDLGFSWQF